MHKNPALAKYTAGGDQVPMEVINKAAKKKDIELLRAELKETAAEGIQKVARGRATRKGRKGIAILGFGKSTPKDTDTTTTTKDAKGAVAPMEMESKVAVNRV